MLSLIGRYCHRIKSLRFSYNDIQDLEFARKYGHQLEELVIDGYKISQIKKFVEFCPNLKKVNDYQGLLSTIKNENFLPKVENFGKISYFNEVRGLTKLSDKYSQTMKTLNVRLTDLTGEELKTCFECIARFENLKVLKVKFGSMYSTEPIDDCLSLIGQKCTKLLKLDLYIIYSVPISDRFFKALSEFKSIKKLKITSRNHSVTKRRIVVSLKHCKQLKRMWSLIISKCLYKK